MMTDGLFTLPDHHERAICVDVSVCDICVLEPIDGETDAVWIARVTAIARQQISDGETDACVNGHPWLPETTRMAVDGFRRCVLCAREASRRKRRKQRELEQVAS